MTLKEGFEKKAAAPAIKVQLLTFCLDDQEYALHIANVVQVVRMVAITRAPRSPSVVEGMINVRGKVIPVVNLRQRFGLPARPYGLNNHLLIAKTDGRVMALIVDLVNKVRSVPASSLDFSSDIGAQMTEYLSAVGKLGDGLLLILDLDKILTFEEGQRVGNVLAELGSMLTPEYGKRLERVLAGTVLS